MTFYWTYVYDGEPDDSDYGSKNAAQHAADEWWEEYCADNNEGMQNGETYEQEIELIAYRYDDDGERNLFTTIKATVVYEHYHGDLKEHGYVGL